MLACTLQRVIAAFPHSYESSHTQQAAEAQPSMLKSICQHTNTLTTHFCH